jgi:NAD(P)-dependent dehydrogenase (short-subunit alcohol dehydrogenase family)
MLPLLLKGGADSSLPPVLLSVGSVLGSLGILQDPARYFAPLPTSVAYGMSKAALNYLVLSVANDTRWRAAGGIAVSVDPGWVKTAMGNAGGRTAFMEPAESAAALRALLERLAAKDNGTFVTHEGQPLPL